MVLNKKKSGERKRGPPFFGRKRRGKQKSARKKMRRKNTRKDMKRRRKLDGIKKRNWRPKKGKMEQKNALMKKIGQKWQKKKKNEDFY